MLVYEGVDILPGVDVLPEARIRVEAGIDLWLDLCRPPSVDRSAAAHEPMLTVVVGPLCGPAPDPAAVSMAASLNPAGQAARRSAAAWETDATRIPCTDD